MPTQDRAARLLPDALESAVQRLCFAGRQRPDGIGLEAEFLAVHVDGVGRPAGRVALATLARWLDLGPPAGESSPTTTLGNGTRVTFEPGGQVELSTRCLPDTVAATDAVADAVGDLLAALAHHRVALAAAGVDPWHPLPDQQLTASRYAAMAAYLASRGPAGAVMMRHTAALQVNLDLGTGAELAERWLAANLLAPVATATFSSASDRRSACLRGTIWRRTDPTRTGVPAALVAGEDDPVQQVAAALRDADVLLVVGADGRARPGRPGWRFGTWLQDGDPVLGWPTEADLATHLTTWFPEVRPRHGSVELRGVDALPARWRPVPAVLLTAALYDPTARQHVLGLLAPHRRDLPELQRRLLRGGLGDPALCALAVEVWSRARQGAVSLGTPRQALATVDAFLDRFTTRGRAPADDLAALRDDPAGALTWASEPVRQEVAL